MSARSTLAEMALVLLEECLELTGSTEALVVLPGSGLPGERLGYRLKSRAAPASVEDLELLDWEQLPSWVETALGCGASGEPEPSPGGLQPELLKVPVEQEGRKPGLLVVTRPGGAYTARDVQALSRLVALFTLALERKQYQERTDAALREKEILVREVHHRVKNNLQVITSLLNLQAQSVKDPRALQVIEDSKNRVRSMAMVHEQLYRSDDLSRVDFGAYTRRLVASLFSAYGVQSSRVRLRLEVPEVALGVDTVVCCGLILHELVSNALKHAFPGDRQGELAISLQPAGPGKWRLVVADTGVGLSPWMDPVRAQSLGLRLVRILAQQLDASLRWESGPGTRFEIEFHDPAGV